MTEKLDSGMVNAIAKDVFLQAQDGAAIELDPEIADALGAFEETAISLRDIEEDSAYRAMVGNEDGQG